MKFINRFSPIILLFIFNNFVEAIKSWYSIVNLRNLINQGVVGVALKQPFLNPVYRPSVC